MSFTGNRAVGTGRPFFIFLTLLLAAAVPVNAQRLFHVDVESKTLHSGSMKVVSKELYYSKGGNLNILWKPGGLSFYTTTSQFGFTTCYYPASNQSVALDPNMYKPEDELLYLFAEGGIEDMGLNRAGFLLKSTKKDGEYTVRRYEPRTSGGMCAWVEVAYNKDFLPVFCAYYNKKGKLITKTYLSNYRTEKGFTFPMRVTEISYFAEKNDSTVKLDIYRNLDVDILKEMHSYRIPADAVPTSLKDNLKSILKSGK